MPASQAFVLMNLDLIAVPLQVGAAGVVTIYCGQRRAAHLRRSPSPSQLRAVEAPQPHPQLAASRCPDAGRRA